jgi:UDP-glucose 4-epimerase
MVIKRIEEGALVTGGSGFIGSHLVEKLIASKVENIKVIDNLSSGDYTNISKYIENGCISFYKESLSNSDTIEKLVANIDTIFHFAAFPEVRYFDNPLKYFEDNIQSTFKMLEAIRKSSVKHLLFSSSSTIYGKPNEIPTPEHYGPLIPISHYGSSKLACESLISSYSHTYGISSYIFRFANVVGSRSRHGIIWDFIEKIKQDNQDLTILGDGTQSKSYIYIQDCIEAMIYTFNSLKDKVNILNIGTVDSVDVISIANQVCKAMKINDIKFRFNRSTEDGSGWLGDVKNMTLDVSKLLNLGFLPKYSSKEAINMAIKDVLKTVNYNKKN